MKTQLPPGRSGAHLLPATPRKHRSIRFASLALLATLFSAPSWAATDLPAARSTDVQSVDTGTSSKSVVANFEATAIPDIRDLMPSGNAPTTASAVPQSRIQKMLQGALNLLGTPYRWGGTTPQGFDCSGLVGYVFRTTLGIDLPRISRDIATRGERVARDQLAEGDLVFFSRTGGRIDHVGIYLGNGQFVHAPRTGRDVSVSRMDSGYWASKFMQARRVTN